MSIEERCTAIADQVVPQYRKMGQKHSCSGHWAKRWQAAWDAACVALGGDLSNYAVNLDVRATTRQIVQVEIVERQPTVLDEIIAHGRRCAERGAF